MSLLSQSSKPSKHKYSCCSSQRRKLQTADECLILKIPPSKNDAFPHDLSLLTSNGRHDIRHKKVAFFLKSQGVSLLVCVQFFNLNHCVVISMHWKVLCICKSLRFLICWVLMYSIYSDLFSSVDLATCQACSVQRASRLGCDGRVWFIGKGNKPPWCPV